MQGVYAIRNTVTGKTYIGSTNNMRVRWQNHKDALRWGTHSNRFLQADYNNYGLKAFEFTALEELQNATQEELYEREQFFMDNTNDELYNICPKAKSPVGVKRSAEYVAKHSGKNHPFYGRRHTEEAKHVLSVKQSRKWLNPEYRMNASLKHKGQGIKAVVCVETGVRYESLKSAGEAVNRDPSRITECCNGKSITAGGFHWKWAEELLRSD